MRVISLASGSSGNALLVEAGPRGRTKLLVDVGISMRTLIGRLLKIGVAPEQLCGILVTHEHSDHVAGLPSFIRRYSVPVYVDPRTYEHIDKRAIYSARDINPEEATVIPEVIALKVGTTRMIGDIEVTSFPVSHDAVAPCGFLLHAGGCRVCVITDSGEVTSDMLSMMGQADLLVLEANHDRERLLRGPYPRRLKARILSSTGHLSNMQAAEAVLKTWRSDGLRWLWLAHLSKTNNTPALALESIRDSIQEAGANPTNLHISVSPPGMGGVWDSTQLWSARSLWEMSF
ncbi:phosphoribosyl 1,2-cyclic phosphodiesterase [Thermosporothrix hazakensis]|jgi:phosphoribosyl 1,2-cyclic phosphodiesterase|uniref:Phosphoribosyl 1,2-cyclic phosphodiesterase n=1 Tax=Thermosporothrix hazakensis TaxID=644383 RepID=A0A326UFY3_THEHA|nr:MBL fold metallo-hydrolase [Thermosporothrix hazakensis]PZW36864.1 phosphoribosyl 1,2-cyclic phosphodiesterase [Thermosporothrix hazakensis]GCE47512.1 MBL fold metallo-hydrolase [Thermosporothrix hazakensis]